MQYARRYHCNSMFERGDTLSNCTVIIQYDNFPFFLLCTPCRYFQNVQFVSSILIGVTNLNRATANQSVTFFTAGWI